MSNLNFLHSGGNKVTLSAPTSDPSSNPNFKLPQSDGSAGQVLKTDGNGNLSWVTPGTATTNGITEYDQWYLTAGTITSNGDITSNLSRMNFPSNASQIGTGMSQSSGVFTFPNTGKWLVICNASLNCDGSDTVIIFTATTTNNSSYQNVALAMDGNNGSGNRLGAATSMFLLDVTDTSQVKVKFVVGSISGGSSIRGTTSTSDAVTTNFVFVRIGDT